MWSLEYRGDTLLALWGLFPPHPRSISFDAGRNWKPIDSTAWDAGDPVDSSGTGVRFRRHGGALLRSLDHGATWEPCPGMELYGDVTGFSVRSDAYAATRPGNLIRSQDSGSSWQVVAVGDRPATPSLIAAAGNDICYSSRLGIHCSGDFGESFRLLCPNPWPKDQLGMDLGNGKVYLFPKQVAHGQSVVVGEIRPGGSWRKFPFPGSNNEISGLGARDSTVLVLRTHWDSIMISRDYGGRFKTVASTVFRGFIGQPRLGRNLWAYPFGSIYYSSADQGKAWKASPFAPFTARENGFAVADSDVVCASGNGSLWRNRISDTGWKAMPLPAGDSAYSVAAADTVLYAAVRGAILRQPLYGTAVGLRRRKQARYPTQRPKGPALASPGRTPPPPRVDARGRLFP